MSVYLRNEGKFEMKERKKERKNKEEGRRVVVRRPGGASGAGRARASPKGREVVLGGFLLEELWLMFWWRW